MAATTLILGFGNLDRQDDGIAWHILRGLAELLGRPAPDEALEFGAHGEDPTLAFVLQLTPDLAEILAGFQRVCFVDAHTGEMLDEVSFQPIQPAFQLSPFTHHLTPQTLLSLTENLYSGRPQGWLLAVRGYEFGFGQELSPRAAELAQEAVRTLFRWCKSDLNPNVGKSVASG
jgi:hydrogenase maturation protease